MINRLSLTAALLCAAIPLSADPMDGIVSVEVIPGWATQNGTHMAGLRISLAPGWKTYWRAPGDAGIPPIINFSSSSNVAATALQWPVPEVFYEGNLRSLGYYGEVVVPVELTPATQGGPITLSGEMQIGICEEICVPAHLTFQAEIPPGGDRAPAIVASLINRPLSESEAGVIDATCAFEPKDNGVVIKTTLAMPHTGGTESVVIEAGDPHVWVSEPETFRSGNTLVATSYMVHSNGEGFALDRSAIRITVLGDNHAVDVRGCTPG